ncbi:MAG: HD domain-containing protein [Selenomonadaceae bacterium]|nr:HD domain-containing protein [Selenomonadaceae bacterium]
MRSLISRALSITLLLIVAILNVVSAEDFDDQSRRAMEVASKYYERGRERAWEFKELRTYSDHGINHANLVAIKSQQAADIINMVLEARPNVYYAPVDRYELQIAALFHDTGMDGGTFKDYPDGNKLRKDHSLNSAIHVLENRSLMEELDVDADRVALDCMLHSKSCSGVRDLTSVADWNECFTRIDQAVNAYNEKYPEAVIYFDTSDWTDNPDVLVEGATYSFNRAAMAQTASIAAALRIGDANREAAQYPYTQGGERIEVDFDSYARDADTWQDEVKNADVSLINERGDVLSLKGSSNGYDKLYSAGEGNLSMACVYDNRKRAFEEVFMVHHAMSFPRATQECIEERLGELDTMKHLPVQAAIRIDGSGLDRSELQRLKKSYRQYCKAAKKKHGFAVKLYINR